MQQYYAGILLQNGMEVQTPFSDYPMKISTSYFSNTYTTFYRGKY